MHEFVKCNICVLESQHIFIDWIIRRQSDLVLYPKIPRQAPRRSGRPTFAAFAPFASFAVQALTLPIILNIPLPGT